MGQSCVLTDLTDLIIDSGISFRMLISVIRHQAQTVRMETGVGSYMSKVELKLHQKLING